MSTETLIALLALIVFGTYVQTITGFGLGIIVIGVATALNLTSVVIIAAVVSLVTLVNCAIALYKNKMQLDWAAIKFVIIGVFPGMLVGVTLLNILSISATNLLQGLLGVMILYSGLNLFISPNKQAIPSGNGQFLISGFASGLTGGLFGMSGPPLIAHFYKQPFDIKVIRNMLLMVFACTATTRSVLTGLQGQLDSDVLTLTVLAIPLVMLTTLLGQRFPLPLSQTAMKRAVFMMLMLIGLYLLTLAVKGYFL